MNLVVNNSLLRDDLESIYRVTLPITKHQDVAVVAVRLLKAQHLVNVGLGQSDSTSCKC